MFDRVTQQTVQRSTLHNLQSNLTSMAALQAQMSSGKKLQRPSDDPALAGQAMHLRGTARQIAQYQRNAIDGDSWLSTVDTALVGSLATLRRVRDLVVNSGDGAYGVASREALAVEVEQLHDDLVTRANTQYQGRTVFAGTSDAGVAFDAAYTWTGAAGAAVERRISASSSVRVDADGSAAFGEGATSVFALVDDVAATLHANGDASGYLDAIDARMQSMLTAAATNGSRQRVLQASITDLSSQAQTVRSQLSGVEDIDLAEVIMDLGMQEVAYRGALDAGSRVLQPSLLDFLK